MCLQVEDTEQHCLSGLTWVNEVPTKRSVKLSTCVTFNPFHRF